MANYFVYKHYNKNGDLLYVGYTATPMRRLYSHKRHSHWFLEIHKIKIWIYPSKEKAKIAERIAILEGNPKHNAKPYDRANAERIDRFMQLREKGLTLEEIGENELPPITKQRVQQILEGHPYKKMPKPDKKPLKYRTGNIGFDLDRFEQDMQKISAKFGKKY